MSFNVPQNPLPQLPAQPAVPPMFGAAINPGTKPKAKAAQPTFLGAGLQADQTQAPSRTLIGGSST